MTKSWPRIYRETSQQKKEETSGCDWDLPKPE
jgi:hypothetical protein